MKKFISILLVLCMVLGLCACAGGTGGKKSGLQVGYSRVNITPTYSVPLAGYGNSSLRMSQGFLDYMYATCIAITDENNLTLLLITMDFTATYTNIVEPLHSAITEATGVPAERIMISSTHVHSGPDMTNSNEPNIGRYKVELYSNVAKAAAEAMADRSPATMEIGRSESEDLSFVRHYTTTSGKLYSDNMSLDGEMTGHHHDPDDEIQAIIFKRAAEDKKDILAVNWQAHIKLDSTAETLEGTNNRPMLTSDGVGSTRTYVENNSDYLFAFYLGASGNLNTYSKITSENRTTKSKEFGDMLGAYVLEATKDTKPVNGTVIKEAHCQVEAVVDKSEDHLVIEARNVSEVWAATNNFSQAVAAAPDSGIVSPYHAGSILSRASNNEGKRAVTLNAFNIGGIGLVTAPYEMFDTNAVYVKDNSPFETTFVLTMCNGANSYIAAEYAFEGTGTYEVHNRLFEKGTAEKMADSMLTMLNEIAK